MPIPRVCLVGVIGFLPTAAAVLVVGSTLKGPSAMSDPTQVVGPTASEADVTADQQMRRGAFFTRLNKSVTVATRLSHGYLAGIERLTARLKVPPSSLIRGWILSGLKAHKDETVQSTIEKTPPTCSDSANSEPDRPARTADFDPPIDLRDANAGSNAHATYSAFPMGDSWTDSHEPTAGSDVATTVPIEDAIWHGARPKALADFEQKEWPAMILPKVRDPRFVTIRRGGTLTDSGHHLLALWAASCAEHVLDLFESARPEDPRPRQAIEHARAWVRGEVTMMRARAAGGHAMGAARDLRGPARYAAYAAGQAGAVAHVAAHELGAAAYAIKAARAAGPEGESEAAGRLECQWQRDQLPGAIRELVLQDQRLRNDICWSVFDC